MMRANEAFTLDQIRLRLVPILPSTIVKYI